MTKLEKLKAAKNLSDLAHILEIKPRKLSHALYIKDHSLKYTQFDIPKRSGGVRTIKAPYPGLKIIQSRLSTLLQDCCKEIDTQNASIANKKNYSSLSHGFKPKHSIFTNANNHRKKRYVFNTDLENFFGTINFGRVRGFFISNNDFKLDQAVATVIAQIACHENSLPQGSPCSPIISNLVGHLLDIRLVDLAAKYGCRYSRYADDLTFSTSKKEFPPQIAISDGTLWKTGESLEKLILKAGFKINHSKSRMQSSLSRQDVTGLVVNKRVNTNSRYRSIARAKVHELIKTGIYYVNNTKTESGTIDQLNGILGFIDSIDLMHKKGIASSGNLNHKDTVLSCNEKVYRRFLIYKHFYAGIKPLIVFEGETDEIYLREAIRSLADKFPLLATKSESGKMEFNMKLFHRSKTSGRLLGLNGGTGEFKDLIKYITSETRKFHRLDKKQPVILFIDNDSGGKTIIDYSNGILSKGGEKIVDSKSEFIRLNEHLYILPTPLLKDKSSAIEDFFDSKTLSTKLNKKTFNPNSKTFDPNLHYGKTAFATQVIQANASKIDFSGFISVLERLQKVLTDFKEQTWVNK